MAKTDTKFVTLGDKLAAVKNKTPSKIPVIVLLSLLIGGVAGGALHNYLLGAGAFVLCGIILFAIAPAKHEDHLLIRYDRQGFMADLKLSQKTALFDGSNLYHFGLDNKIGNVPLGALVGALRSEGYRIVCFFDANIYFRLLETGAFPKINKQFSIAILQSIFELTANEIYIVPKGTQADKFIVETLSHMPISFAVTNDRFRDYEKDYPFLATDKQWRKGVKILGRQLKLYQHKFKFPLVVK